MGSISRLEARITVPTGGWGGTIDDSGGGSAVAWSVPAGSYYMSELLAALYAALNVAAPTDTIFVSISNGVGGTGRVTISGSGVFAIVWVDPEIRDLLGYTGNLSAASSYLAPGHARALWLPDTPYNAPNEIYPWGGWPETDLRSVESASGLCWIYAGQKKETTWLEWAAVRRSRASKANESIVGESAQRFIEDGIWGFAPWAQPGGPIRVYPDADGTAYAEYFAVGLKDFVPDQFVDGWAGGPWKVRLPRLVLISTGELVPTDGPSAVYVPQSALHWIALGLEVPHHLWLCQESSGNLIATIGSVAFLPFNSPLYQQSVAGWTRKFVGTVDATTGVFSTNGEAVLNVAAGESYAMLSYTAVASAVQRTFTSAQNGGSPNAGENEWQLEVGGILRTYHGPGSAVSPSGGYNSLTTIHPLLWYRASAADRPAGAQSGTLSDLHSIVATHSELAAGNSNRTIGAYYVGATAPNLRCGLHAVWKGPRAASIAQRSTLARLRWPLSY